MGQPILCLEIRQMQADPGGDAVRKEKYPRSPQAPIVPEVSRRRIFRKLFHSVFTSAVHRGLQIVHSPATGIYQMHHFRGNLIADAIRHNPSPPSPLYH